MGNDTTLERHKPRDTTLKLIRAPPARSLDVPRTARDAERPPKGNDYPKMVTDKRLERRNPYFPKSNDSLKRRTTLRWLPINA